MFSNHLGSNPVGETLNLLTGPFPSARTDVLLMAWAPPSGPAQWAHSEGDGRKGSVACWGEIKSPIHITCSKKRKPFLLNTKCALTSST